MVFQTGQTIKKTLEQMHKHDLVLPAIQREFVWSPEQICRLFDSLLQGYPFGTFLYWKIEASNSNRFRLFDFVRDYHQRDNPHCPPLPDQQNRPLTAVLDGQQRLTALNIGLYGSMAIKQPRLWWNNPDAFPKRSLHLDLLWRTDEEEEEGIRYRFRFLTNEQARGGPREECWFRVAEILEFDDPGPAMTAWLVRHVDPESMESAHHALFRLFQVVHTDPLIAYYEETDQDLDKALQIFIRMNDGGTPLSFSDLLLSIAVAQWTSHDARQEIHELVDDLNRIGDGFRFSKDFVLKAGLMLSDIGSLRFQVSNFNRSNMATFEESWDRVKDSLTLTVQLANALGFNSRNLSSHNSLLPIAYYLHLNGFSSRFLTHSEFSDDRDAIRDWLIRSLLKAGVWGSAVDTLLAQLRAVIRESDSLGFPVSRLESAMTPLGKSLRFEDEEIEDLVDMQYGDRMTFALLSLIFPFVDLKNLFHVDHVFPRKAFDFRNLRREGIGDEQYGDYWDKRDRLPNLQLLEGAINTEKSATMPHEWLATRFPPDRAAEYCEKHLLGGVPESLVEFGQFYDQRRTRLRERIIEVLGRR